MTRLLRVLCPIAVALAACGDGRDVGVATTEAVAAFEARLGALDDAVDDWAEASSIDEAHVAAETAANLVVGAEGPGYGDRDDDGTVSGGTGEGLLPGSGGAPPGLARPLVEIGCVERDVLGGDWDDPADRWATMAEAVDDWRPGRNTMPSLPSHPMRVVGWATFTLDTDDLDEAREYAGHARLHVDVSRRALDC